METYFSYYPLISLFLTTICFIKIKLLSSPNIDIFEALDGLNEAIEELKEEYGKIGVFIERVIDSLLEGNMVTMLIFLYTIFLIPILRWILAVKLLFSKSEEEE